MNLYEQLGLVNMNCLVNSDEFADDQACQCNTLGFVNLVNAEQHLTIWLMCCGFRACRRFDPYLLSSEMV